MKYIEEYGQRDPITVHLMCFNHKATQGGKCVQQLLQSVNHEDDKLADKATATFFCLGKSQKWATHSLQSSRGSGWETEKNFDIQSPPHSSKCCFFDCYSLIRLLSFFEIRLQGLPAQDKKGDDQRQAATRRTYIDTLSMTMGKKE